MQPLSPGQPGSRRRHHKSRTGCRVCKSRKIKCDEHRPSCSNCINYEVECDFLTTVLTRLSPSRCSSAAAKTDSQPLGMVELELLHHYSTSTCHTLASDPVVRNFWRVDVPKFGFSNECILRGLLALAALHIARFKTEQRDFYLAQSIVHHNAASAMASPLIPNMTPEQSAPLWLFSVITFFISLASPREENDLLSARGGAMPEWLFLFQGVRCILQSEREMIRASPLGAMFQTVFKIEKTMASTPSYSNEGFEQIEDRIRVVVDDPQKQEILFQAMHELKRNYGMVYERDSESRGEMACVFSWLFKISDDYLNLLRQKDSAALCVFGLFCVLLKRLEHHWWVNGWGTHLIKQIYYLLNSAYRLWIRWSIEEIGWVPGTGTGTMGG